MSDYPMLISNKLHSFRNFVSAKIRKWRNIKKCVDNIMTMYQRIFLLLK